MLAGLVATVSLTAGCGWQGANSLPLPGTEGSGPGAYTITAQLPDVGNIQQNSRVRVGDVREAAVGDHEAVRELRRQVGRAVLEDADLERHRYLRDRPGADRAASRG